MQIYAVRIFVSNWDRACAFYEDQLGLPLRFASTDLGWAEFNAGGPSIAIERADEASADLVGRFVGISLLVDDLDATYHALTDKGVEFTQPPTEQTWGGRIAHVRDPDGNVLTLLQY